MDMGEKYRPATLDSVAGQGKAVAQIKRSLERSGWSGACWWLYGASGTGKTTLARIIAGMEAGEHSTREFVGRNMSVEDCRAMMDAVPCSSMFGGRAWIINEAQDLSEACLGMLLDIAELVKKSKYDCLILTSMTEPSLLDAKGAKYHALMGRCHRPDMALTSDSTFQSEVIDYLYGVAIEEEIPATPGQLRAVCEREQWSVRAALSRLELGLDGVDGVEEKPVTVEAPAGKVFVMRLNDSTPPEVPEVPVEKAADSGVVEYRGIRFSLVASGLSAPECRKQAAKLGGGCACWQDNGKWVVAVPA